MASALVSSRLDYANYVLFGCPQKHAARLQRVQRALARVVTEQSSISPLTSTELLKQLHCNHWLPILFSFSQSCPLAASAMRLDSLLRPWRYINLLLTYLLR